MGDRAEKSAFARQIIVLLVLLFVMVIGSGAVAFSRSGFDTQIIIDQFQLYGVYGVASAFGLFLIMFVQYLQGDDDEEGDATLFYDPGNAPGIPAPFLERHHGKVMLVFTVLAIIAGFFMVYKSNTFFTGFELLEQQFTPLDNLIYNLLLVVISENLTAAFVIAFGSFLILRYSKKNDLEEWQRTLLVYVFIPLFSMLFGLLNHLLRYRDQDLALVYVMIFWLSIGVLTALFKSIWPGLILHGVNNFFGALKELYGSDTVVAITVGSIVVAIGILGGMFYLARRRKHGDG